MVNNWIDIIQNYLLPPTCILCGRPGLPSMDICHHCKNQLIRNQHCCYRCGAVLEKTIDRPLLCGACQIRKASFDETHAPFIHHGAIRHLIASLKFHAQFKNARLLGMLMAEYLKMTAERPECLIPVPLHPAVIENAALTSLSKSPARSDGNSVYPWTFTVASGSATHPTKLAYLQSGGVKT